MDRRIRRLWIAIGLAAVLGGAAPAEEQKGLQVGDEAPAFTLPGSDGEVHSLADYRGKSAVVIAWFPKAFTGG